MALARVKTWNAAETLTAADLNSEFNQISNHFGSIDNDDINSTASYVMGELVIGSGITSADGGQLHVFTATAGSVQAHADADEAVLENSGAAGMTILSGATSTGTIAFGDAADNDNGLIKYTHGSTPTLALTVDGSAVQSIAAAATTFSHPITVGQNDQGYDVKFFGDTASAYLLWDTSADKLLTAGGAVIDIVKDKLLIGGTAVTTTAAELNVLDAVTAGTVAASKAVVVDSNKDIASFRNVTLTGELDAATLDISGDADIDGTLEADAITIGGTAIGSIYGVVAGSSSITTVGTIGTGTWQGTAIASAYLDADTAHLSTTQTFTGDKTFTGTVTVGVDDTGKDVKFFGATSGSSLLWDESADDLILTNAGLAVGSDATGDLYYRNSSGFLARLGVGSDGQVLTSTGTLPNWEAAASSGISWDGSTANGVATYKDGDEATVESNLTFTGSALTVTGTATVTSTITAGGVVDVTDGSASAPAICNTGDTNTGILFPAADTIGMTTAGTERVRIGSDGEVLVNETANGNQSAGAMTLNQDANDAGILALKSSDVAHGVTDYAETDTYGEFLKANAPTGGLIVRGYDENANGLQMWGIYADDSSNSNLSAKTASATAPVSVIVAKKSGTGLAQVPADENIFMIQSWGQSARFVVDEDGEIYSDGAHSTFDEFDDVQLLRAVDHSLDAPGLLMGKFDDMLEYNEASLIEAGLLGGPRKGQPESDRGLINYTGMVRLQSGAIWQLYTQQREMREVLENQVKELRDEILALRENN